MTTMGPEGLGFSFWGNVSTCLGGRARAEGSPHLLKAQAEGAGDRSDRPLALGGSSHCTQVRQQESQEEEEEEAAEDKHHCGCKNHRQLLHISGTPIPKGEIRLLKNHFINL